MSRAHDEAHDLNDIDRRILTILKEGAKSVRQIAADLGYPNRSGHLKRALGRLAHLGLIALALPDKPRSKSQKRVLTGKGREVLDQR
jgi:hypothetical protein